VSLFRDINEQIRGKQFHFYDYRNSIYDYVKFDSFTEKQLADYQEKVINQLGKQDKPFCVRNQRNIYFSYSNKKYYPDFIMYYQGMIYMLEAKGEIYNDWRKRILLTKLNEIAGYMGLLIFSKQLDEMGDEVWDLKRFIEYSEKVVRDVENSNKMMKDIFIDI